MTEEVKIEEVTECDECISGTVFDELTGMRICQTCGHMQITRKIVIPKGVCACVGCNTKLRRRKLSITWYEHMANIEQNSNYCRPCITAGHNIMFQAKWVDGKRVITNLEQVQRIQRGMHK